jgi:hypothetical protein
LGGKNQPIRNQDKIQKRRPEASGTKPVPGAGVSDYSESHQLGLLMCM